MKNKKDTREEPLPFDGTMPEGTPIPAKKKSGTKKRKKVTIISVFLVLCVLGGAGWYLLYGNPALLNRAFQNLHDHAADTEEEYIFYPADYDLDVTTVREYMELDRDIHYKNGAETILITDTNAKFYGPDVQFFKQYFASVITGDHETYNSLFTSHYYETNDPHSGFTQQMIYDITIEKLSQDNTDAGIAYTYNVSYKIHQNNGTFRRDIGSDGARTQRFALLESDGTVLIDSITTYMQ